MDGNSDPTTVERVSDRELVVTRTFKAPARIVFEAWTKAELFRRWWAPKSYGLTILSCEIDARTGGGYKIEFAHPDGPMAFFGKYIDVIPNARLVWTNEEDPDGQVTTVTFEERGGETVVVMSDLYPSKAALDEALVSGGTGGFSETFAQLEELLVTQGAGVEGA